jgi:hypothetical protein
MSANDGSQKNAYSVSGTSPPGFKIALEILEFLNSKPHGVTEAEIQTSVRGKRSTKLAALRLLVEDATVIRSGAGIHGSPYLYATAFGVAGSETVQNAPVPGTEKNLESKCSEPTSGPIHLLKEARRTLPKITDVVVSSCHSIQPECDLNFPAPIAITPFLKRKRFGHYGQE